MASTTAPPSTSGQTTPATARPHSVRISRPSRAPGTDRAIIPASTNATALNDESHLSVPYQIEPRRPGASSPMSLRATCRVMAVPKIDQTSTNQPIRASAPAICPAEAEGRNGMETSRSTWAAEVGIRSNSPPSTGSALRLGVRLAPLPGTIPDADGRINPSAPACPATAALATRSAARSTPGSCKRSASDQPAHVARQPRAARRKTVGAKAVPAARNRIHHGSASLHWIS